MTFTHGKDTYVSLDGEDISPYTNNVAYNRSADSHDTTTFGKRAHTYQGGLKDGTATLTGIYDNTAAGPRAVVGPLLGTVVELVYRPEGTGATKPEDTVDVLVTAYEETSPVADMVAWSATCQLSDDVVTTDQV